MIEIYTKDMDVVNTPISSSDDSLPLGVLGLEIQSGRVRFQKPAVGGKPPGGGVRGRVSVMSDSSRRRLMAKFASLDYECLAELKTPLWFVTLTTPPAYWDDARGVYQALRRFRDALDYSQTSQGYLGAFVRREIGSKRGMLHYHLVVVGGHLWGAEVSRLWTRSLRSDIPVRVDVQPLETPERVSKYLSKYCSKIGYSGKEMPVSADLNSVERPIDAAGIGASLSEAHNIGNTPSGYTGGRWWYIWGADKLPWGEVITLLGDEAKAVSKHLKRIFRKWLVEKEVKRIVAARKLIDPSFDAFGLLNCFDFSHKRIEKRLSYASFLRRSSSGFTFLLSPALLQRMIDAACMAVVGSPAKFPWEIGC